MGDYIKLEKQQVARKIDEETIKQNVAANEIRQQAEYANYNYRPICPTPLPNGREAGNDARHADGRHQIDNCLFFIKETVEQGSVSVTDDRERDLCDALADEQCANNAICRARSGEKARERIRFRLLGWLCV